MSLAEQMIADATSILANEDEHAVLRDCIDHFGKTIKDVPLIIEDHSTDVEKTPQGRTDMHRARVGLPTTYEVTEEWGFDIDDNQIFWAVDRDVAASILYDGAGWQWVAITSGVIVDRGNPEYRGA